MQYILLNKIFDDLIDGVNYIESQIIINSNNKKVKQ